MKAIQLTFNQRISVACITNIQAIIFFSIALAILILKSTVVTAEELPPGVVWETNNKEPIFENYKPQKGGEFRDYIPSYPQTFRLYGPNSNNGSFVSYNRRWAFLSLINRHQSTSKIVPELATHWYIKDQKTVYYKLDPEATWSDGKPITADDYVFVYEFMQSPHIQSPYYNQYVRDTYEEIVKIDKYTLKIVLKNPSWKILDETNLSPVPKHVTKLDKNWIKSTQWVPNVVPGPYVIKSFKKGSYIIFERNQNWWGYNKRYFKNLFNFDKIRLDVFRTTEAAYEAFKKGKLSIFIPSSLIWKNKTDISEVNNGYIFKQSIYIKNYSGPTGFFFNSQRPVWNDKSLRQAFGYTIDFDTINKNFFDGSYVRADHFFNSIDPYFKKDFKTYPFDLVKSNKILDELGWKRDKKTGIRQKNSQSLVLDIVTGSDDALKYLPYIKQVSRKAGIEVNIKKYDGAQFFDIIDDRNFDLVLLTIGGGYFPSPRQFLHTENKVVGTSNNIFLFGNESVDELIKTYELDLDESKRVKAIYELESTIKDEAIFLPIWRDASVKLMRWRYIGGPEGLAYKTGISIDLLYYIEKEAENIESAIKENKKLKIAPLEVDAFDLKPKVIAN